MSVRELPYRVWHSEELGHLKVRILVRGSLAGAEAAWVAVTGGPKPLTSGRMTLPAAAWLSTRYVSYVRELALQTMIRRATNDRWAYEQDRDRLVRQLADIARAYGELVAVSD